MGRTRPQKRVRKQQELKLAKPGTNLIPGPVKADGQRVLPYFYSNPIALKRCTAKPTKSVWKRLGADKKYDAFGFHSERTVVFQEEDLDGFSKEEIDEATVRDLDEREAEEITISDSDQEHSQNLEPSAYEPKVEINQDIVDLCNEYSEEEEEVNQRVNDEGYSGEGLIMRITDEEMAFGAVSTSPTKDKPIEETMRDLDLSEDKVPNPFYRAPRAANLSRAISPTPALNADDAENTGPEDPIEELEAVGWPFADDDPDESDDEVWVGSAEDQRRAWLKRWPKTTAEALEPLIDGQPKFTTSFTHSNVCIRIMNTRNHVGDRVLRGLLLNAALGHAKVVSYLHHGTGNNKNKVKEIPPKAPQENNKENTDMQPEQE